MDTESAAFTSRTENSVRGTVPLGTGDADLSALFRGLAALNYSGDYVLQVARSEPSQELAWITQNVSWVVRQVQEAKGLVS